MTLEQALQDILSSVVSAKDFLVEQLPDVVQQLLLWKMVESLLFFSCGVLCFVLTCVLGRIAYKTDDSDVGGCSIALGTLFAVLGSAIGVYNLEWLQILIAPKVYLIEYAASLMK